MSLKRPTASSMDPGFLGKLKMLYVEEPQAVLNPLKVSFDKISHDIIGIHDSHAKRQDVESLYNDVSNIVNSSTQVADFFDSKGPKTVELVPQDSQSTKFMPSFSSLKEIACQMTCKPFSPSTAHQTIKTILEKLKSYTWDAKAVIALAAFALDYGESLQLSLVQSTKQNALELHVFRLGGLEKDKPTQPNSQSKSLVELTLQVIKKIIDLEKKIAEDSTILKEVAGLSAAKREVYTYWAIFALACASQITQLEWNLKSEVVPKLHAVSSELDRFLGEIENYRVEKEALNWGLSVITNPSGILVLLKALTFLKDVDKIDIFDNSTKTMVRLEVIEKQNLLLFISGLENIEDEIWALKPIDEEFKKDKEKQDYRILWIPIVEKWTDETKEKFENLKSKMPWFVVHYSEPFGGLKLLQQEFHYQNKPIVVVTNPRGEIIHKNAMHMIFVWGIKAFPFGPGATLPTQWNWLWSEVEKIHPDVKEWINEAKFIFLYGGVDTSITQRLGNLLDTMKKDPIIKQADASIEHFNLGKIDINMVSKFWDNIDHLFQDHASVGNFEKDSVIEHIEMVLSKKEEKGWVLVSKGENVLAVNCDPLITSVLDDFEIWRKDVIEKEGFDRAFMEYYESKRSRIPLQCSHFQVVNIRSSVPTSLPCPDCDLKMEIQSVRYKCCHGNHHQHAAKIHDNGSINIAIPNSPYKLK